MNLHHQSKLLSKHTPNHEDNAVAHTRKSTPIVAVASSSGNHCSSENRSNKLLFPTEEFPMSSSLTLTGCVEEAMVVVVEVKGE